jgi:hypothetical protein
MTIHVKRDIDGTTIVYSRSCEFAWELDDLILAEANEPGLIVSITVEEE